MAVAETSQSPDAATLDFSKWPRLLLPPLVGKREGHFQAVVRQSVLNTIQRHGGANVQHEVCGVLAGNCYRDDAGPFLLVDVAIPGAAAQSRAAAVTFTAETWAHVQGIMDREHPDKRIVGWYHTHPNFGIFLSGMDLFIHENFFNLPWQVALVYDPIKQEQGLFTWQGGKAAPSMFLIQDDAREETSKVATVHAAEPPAPRATAPVVRRTVPAPAKVNGDTAHGAVHPRPPAMAAPARIPTPASGAAVPRTLQETIARLLAMERKQQAVQAELAKRIKKLQRRQDLLWVALAFLVGFMVAWALVVYWFFPRYSSPAPATTQTAALVTQDSTGAVEFEVWVG